MNMTSWAEAPASASADAGVCLLDHSLAQPVSYKKSPQIFCKNRAGRVNMRMRLIMADVEQTRFLPTRRSLLSRLRDWDDRASWQEFFDTYGRLIYQTARKAGLTDAEAQDVVQETIILVARKMPGFRYDPALGSFKAWLRTLTRRKIEKQLRKRLPGVGRTGALGANIEGMGRLLRGAGAGDPRTATIERIPDPGGIDYEHQWDADWEQNLWAAAVERVKRQVKPKQYQVFDLYALKEWPVGEVARALNVSVALVYVTKHRVGGLIKKELQRLRKESEAER
jgi:RNA polymerase sigma factor (sigma-70 family)